MATDEKIGVNCDWKQSQAYIIEHAKQENWRFGQEKLKQHIINYFRYKPIGQRLDITLRADRALRGSKDRQQRAIRCINQAVNQYQDQIADLKNQIFKFNFNSDDKKQLMWDYLEYMAVRPRGDSLPIGRVRGQTISYREKRILLAINGDSCVLCGSKEHVQIHHIRSLSLDPVKNRDIDNQAPVCKSCHCKLHGKEE